MSSVLGLVLTSKVMIVVLFILRDDFYPLVDKKGIPPELRIVERRGRFTERNGKNHSVICAGQEAMAKGGGVMV